MESTLFSNHKYFLCFSGSLDFSLLTVFFQDFYLSKNDALVIATMSLFVKIMTIYFITWSTTLSHHTSYMRMCLTYCGSGGDFALSLHPVVWSRQKSLRQQPNRSNCLQDWINWFNNQTWIIPYSCSLWNRSVNRASLANLDNSSHVLIFCCTPRTRVLLNWDGIKIRRVSHKCQF